MSGTDTYTDSEWRTFVLSLDLNDAMANALAAVVPLIAARVRAETLTAVRKAIEETPSGGVLANLGRARALAAVAAFAGEPDE